MTENADSVDADVYISCREAARLMCFKRDRALTGEEGHDLNEHLLVCLNCQNFDQQLDVLAALAKRYAAGGTPRLFSMDSTNKDAESRDLT